MHMRIQDLEARHAADEALIDHLATEEVAAQDKIANLELALLSARRIGQAIGILMTRHQITDDDAFGRLRKTSQRLHRKLRDIAEDVVLTGELPQR